MSLPTLLRTKNVMHILITSILLVFSTIQTLSQIKSQEFVDNIQKHFITQVSNDILDFIKCCIKVGCTLTFDPLYNMLFGRLRPEGNISVNNNVLVVSLIDE